MMKFFILKIWARRIKKEEETKKKKDKFEIQKKITFMERRDVGGDSLVAGLITFMFDE